MEYSQDSNTDTAIPFHDIPSNLVIILVLLGIGVKHFDDNRKNIYKRERCQVGVGAKRRKLFHHCSKLDYVHEASSENISNLPERSASGDRKRMPAASHKGP